MELSYSSRALGLSPSSLSELQEAGQAAASPQLLLNTSIFPVWKGHVLRVQSVSSQIVATPQRLQGASALSPTHSLLRSCRGHLAAPSSQVDGWRNWVCRGPGGSVHSRPLGEEGHLTGMLATLGEAERGEIKRSLV